MDLELYSYWAPSFFARHTVLRGLSHPFLPLLKQLVRLLEIGHNGARLRSRQELIQTKGDSLIRVHISSSRARPGATGTLAGRGSPFGCQGRNHTALTRVG